MFVVVTGSHELGWGQPYFLSVEVGREGKRESFVRGFCGTLEFNYCMLSHDSHAIVVSVRHHASNQTECHVDQHSPSLPPMLRGYGWWSMHDVCLFVTSK